MQPEHKSIVVYDTLYGSTEKIAKALAKGISTLSPVDCTNIKQIAPESLAQYTFIAVGAPTQAFSASRPMKDFLRRLGGLNMHGHFGFAFDTKLDNRLSGSAAKYIESRLREMGLEILEPRKSAIVTGGTKASTLNPGEEESFERLGQEIGRQLEPKKKPEA